jgi:hypothetical protein
MAAGMSSSDYSRELKLDSAGNAVITGVTSSSDFPTLAGSYDTTHNGSDDLFVLRLNSVGDDLDYCSRERLL